MHNCLFISLLFLISGLCYYSGARDTSVQIKRYEIEVNYPGMSGKSELDVKADLLLQKNEGTNELEFLFNYKSKILSVECLTEGNLNKVDFKFTDNDIIHLTLPEVLSNATELTIQFNYSYSIEDPVNDICYLDRGYRWYPLLSDNLAFLSLTANVPDEYEMFSAGNLIEVKAGNRISTFKWESKIPVFKIPFIIIKKSGYEKISGIVNEKTISFYILKNDSVSFDNIINEACNVFHFCDSLIGPYHHNSLTIIEMSGLSGSTIGTGIAVAGSDFIQQLKSGYYNYLHLSIAGQWFGSGLFGKFFDDGFWFFSLSLPHYLRLMYLEHSKGTEIFNRELNEPYLKYKETAGSEKDFPVLAIKMIDTKEKGLAVYGKGPYILNILRKQTGDAGWATFLRELYRNFKGRILTFESFKEQLYNIKPGMDLIFEKMMTEKGIIDERTFQ